MSRFSERHPVDDADHLCTARDGEHGGVLRAVRVVETTPARAAALRMRVREASAVRHPNLSRWVAVGEEEGAVVLAREWLPGPALSAPMDPIEAARALIVVLDGLELAHWNDLYHGRIAPERIVRGGGGAPVLVDLGVDGRGSVSSDLRAVVDTLEALAPSLPDALRSVVVSTHQGAYTTARDLQRALHRAVGTAEASGPAWGRWGVVGVAVAAVTAAALGLWGGASLPDSASPDGVRMATTGPGASSLPGPDASVPPADPPPPEAVPAAPAADPGGGPAKWSLQPGAGGFPVLHLIAESPVQDRTGRGGRPVVELWCERGKPTMMLFPGVTSLERVLLENGTPSEAVQVEAVVDGQSVSIRLKTVDGRPNLYLTRRDWKWLAGTTSAASVTFTYPPFASEPVTATFDWRGLREAWGMVGGCEAATSR